MALIIVTVVLPVNRASAARRSCESWTAKQWVSIVASMRSTNLEDKSDDEKLATVVGTVAHAKGKRPECASTFDGFQIWFYKTMSAVESADRVEPPFPLTKSEAAGMGMNVAVGTYAGDALAERVSNNVKKGIVDWLNPFSVRGNDPITFLRILPVFILLALIFTAYEKIKDFGEERRRRRRLRKTSEAN